MKISNYFYTKVDYTKRVDVVSLPHRSMSVSPLYFPNRQRLEMILHKTFCIVRIDESASVDTLKKLLKDHGLVAATPLEAAFWVKLLEENDKARTDAHPDLPVLVIGQRSVFRIQKRLVIIERANSAAFMTTVAEQPLISHDTAILAIKL